MVVRIIFHYDYRERLLFRIFALYNELSNEFVVVIMNVILFIRLAIFLNPKYTKALARRAKAHDITKEKRSALEGLLIF